MATATEPRREAQPPERMPQRDFRGGRERPVGGFELWSWLFMRISGILLLILAVGHVLIMHVQDDGVGRVNFGFVATRWASPLWRTWDWMLLVLALIHGINGLRVITLDYVRKPGLRLDDQHGLLRPRLHAVRPRLGDRVHVRSVQVARIRELT